MLLEVLLNCFSEKAMDTTHLFLDADESIISETQLHWLFYRHAIPLYFMHGCYYVNNSNECIRWVGVVWLAVKAYADRCFRLVAIFSVGFLLELSQLVMY